MELSEILSSQLNPDLQEIVTTTYPWHIVVFPANIVRVLTILRDHPDLRFLQLIDITATDYLPNSPRFELTYHLLSHPHNQRLMVKIHIDENVNVASVINTFPNANWYEREIWDLFGIPFENHPDLRRLLCDYTFSGHALRKDFPLSGYSEVYFNEKNHRVDYKPVDLEQPFRQFNFLSPWEGHWGDLLKQEKEVHD